jgi:hypothetical protein
MGCVAGWFGPGERVGEEPPDLADGERDKAGVGGRGLIGPGLFREQDLGVLASRKPAGDQTLQLAGAGTRMIMMPSVWYGPSLPVRTPTSRL